MLLRRIWNLFYNEMRSWDEHDQRGEDCVDCQSDQAESVYNHRRKLPVSYCDILLILLPQSSGHVPITQSIIPLSLHLGLTPDLLQYELDLLGEVDGGGEGSPGTAAVVGVAAGGVWVSAVRGDLLLGRRVETNLWTCQGSGHKQFIQRIKKGK